MSKSEIAWNRFYKSVINCIALRRLNKGRMREVIDDNDDVDDDDDDDGADNTDDEK